MADAVSNYFATSRMMRLHLRVGGCLLLAINLTAMLLHGAPDGHHDAASQETVILLHGLARSPRSMQRMQHALQQHGYTVHTLSYPSRQKTVERIVAENLTPFIAQCQSNAPDRIHFVAHSLGNILLRHYFVENTLTNAGRMVMLGPPNQGSEVVDKLGDWAMFEWLNGPAGCQLGTASNALPQTLPAPPLEFGIIAGTRSINWILSSLIPGADDGKVSLERAKLKGARDFVVVPVAHPFLMKNKKVIALTVRFLQTGTFSNCATTVRSKLNGECLKPQHRPFVSGPRAELPDNDDHI